MKDIEANFRAARVGTAAGNSLVSLTYALALDDMDRRIVLDPRGGNAAVDWLRPGNHAATRLFREYSSEGGPKGATEKASSEIGTRLNASFTVQPRQITVSPCEFVYVSVNEERRIGAIALKMRPPDKEERDAIAADLEQKGMLSSRGEE